MSKYIRFVIFPLLLIAVGCEAAVDFALDDHHPDGDPAAAISTRVADGRLSKERTTEVQAIWHEYRSNEALANSRYRGQYYTVGGLVERIDEHGVDFVMDTYDMGASSARFARSAQNTLLTISPYDVVILSCRVRGLVLDLMFSFEDCIPVAWPGADAVTWPEADTGVGTATSVPATTRSAPIRRITPLPTVTPTLLIPTNTPGPTERPVWTVITYRTVTGIIVYGYEQSAGHHCHYPRRGRRPAMPSGRRGPQLGASGRGRRSDRAGYSSSGGRRRHSVAGPLPCHGLGTGAMTTSAYALAVGVRRCAEAGGWPVESLAARAQAEIEKRALLADIVDPKTALWDNHPEFRHPESDWRCNNCGYASDCVARPPRHQLGMMSFVDAR